MKIKPKKAKKVRALVFSGYGLNCEEEAAYGFTLAGAEADIVHINDIIDGKVSVNDYQILCFPGGFAYGDDTGSGKAYANRVKNHLGKDLATFLSEGKLIIGICNGFQILTELGLLPGALTYNDSNRYTDRWVDLEAEGESPWLTGITRLSVPVAHGEGKFVAPPKELAELKKKKMVALRYVKGEMCAYQDLPLNPSGTMEDIAGVLSHEGRVFGLMPHPDRALFSTQLPHWPLLKERARRGESFPEHGPGLAIFENGVNYFPN
ncbi:MAG: phosphoribosylformylglycinamidine synthase I [Patescibacteria group bacterium]|nr:phosphoribosylformylglycinamidine synthase I [Patescibacteria group bacterium]